MERVGLIGLGNVGSGFAEKLLDVGHPLSVLDKERGRMQPAISAGAKPADNPGDIADDSDIVLLSLPGSPAVEAVMEGDDGVLAHLREGHLIVDTGTSRPDTAVRYDKLCRRRSAGFIDAPITGRSAGWIMMVGGTEENFEKGRKVLTSLSYKLEHIGPIGHGQLLKLVNQLVLAGQWAVWGEAIEFSRKVGLAPRLLSDCLEFSVPEVMYGDDFSAGGHLALHYKDLGYIFEVAHDAEASIPVTSFVHEAFKAAKVAGEANWGQAGVVTYWRRLNQPEAGG